MKRRPLLAAVTLLGGCAVGPDYEKPEIDSPVAFGSADSAVYIVAEPVISWWQTLDDPLLNEWIETAVLRNHDIRIAETNLRASREVLGARKLERYPIATSQFSALEREESAAVSALPDREQRLYDLTLDAVWELDFFGRVRRSVQAAAADANAATEVLRDTFVIVSAELARTYFELKGARYRLSVAQRNAENQQQTFELTQALLAGGRGTDLDIARARAQLETTLASIPPLERDINSGSHRLAVLLGESPTRSRRRSRRMPSCPLCRRSSISATPRGCCAGAPTCASPSTHCKRKRRASALLSPISSHGSRYWVPWGTCRRRPRISAIATHASRASGRF